VPISRVWQNVGGWLIAKLWELGRGWCVFSYINEFHTCPSEFSYFSIVTQLVSALFHLHCDRDQSVIRPSISAPVASLSSPRRIGLIHASDQAGKGRLPVIQSELLKLAIALAALASVTVSLT